MFPNHGTVAILHIEYRDEIKTQTSGIVKGFFIRCRRVSFDPTGKHDANANAKFESR
jgi:hypothetical protein